MYAKGLKLGKALIYPHLLTEYVVRHINYFLTHLLQFQGNFLPYPGLQIWGGLGWLIAVLLVGDLRGGCCSYLELTASKLMERRLPNSLAGVL